MNTQHAGTRFWTLFLEDAQAGFSGLRLLKEQAGQQSFAAEVIFWDAAGQFYVQTFGEVPVTIMEALIAETRDAVRTA